MKTATVRNNTTTENIESYSYELYASPELFDSLIKGIYKQPIEAIIRELSTNAADAHTEAGHDRPFDVYLPSRFDSKFIIRDYGPGLTPDKMRDVFTKIGKSDKNESNDFTGCFGLGSKSPFAYTDQFLIESFIDGKKYCYLSFIGEDGIPQLGRAVDQGIPMVMDTDEPNGTRITIQVNSYDCYKFVDVSKRTYQFFKVRPNIHGQTIYYDEEILSGDGYKYFNNQNSYAVMGNVAYPLEHPEAIKGVSYYFDIGDLEIVASRDALRDCEKTRQSLKKILVVNQAIADEYNKKLKTVIKLQDAWTLYSTFPVKGKTEFNGHEITSTGVKLSDNIELIVPNTLKDQSQNTDTIHQYHMNRLSFIYLDSLDSYKLRLNDNRYNQCCILARNPVEKIRLCVLFGIQDSDFVDISTLPVIHSNRASNYGFTKPTFSEFSYNVRATQCWQSTEHDFEDGGIYVQTMWYDAINTVSGKRVNHNSLEEMIIVYQKIVGHDIDVYGIVKRDVETFKNSPLWTDFFTLFEEIQQNPYFIAHASKLAWLQECEPILERDDVDEVLLQHRTLRRIKRQQERLNAKTKGDSAEYKRYFKLIEMKPIKYSNFYPMLEYGNYYWEHAQKDAINYINLVNGAKNA